MSRTNEIPLSVLIIDDQKTMRSIVRSLLNRIGIEAIAEAENGQEALRYLKDPRSNYPDVIICDLHMAAMDGLEFCNAVRRSKALLRNTSVPILILTGDQDPLLHEVSHQVGALSILTKPVTAEELKTQITSAVGYVFG